MASTLAAMASNLIAVDAIACFQGGGNQPAFRRSGVHQFRGQRNGTKRERKEKGVKQLFNMDCEL